MVRLHCAHPIVVGHTASHPVNSVTQRPLLAKTENLGYFQSHLGHGGCHLLVMCRKNYVHTTGDYVLSMNIFFELHGQDVVLKGGRVR